MTQKIALTGQQVHAAHNKVRMERMAALHMKFTSSTITEWQELSPQDKGYYERMAYFLNPMLDEQEEHDAD